MTITSAYRKANKQMHTKPGYGSSGHLWLGHVVELCELAGCNSVLDYGCGKATLGRYLGAHGIAYTPYDPATYPKRPKGKSDLVVALDVMEHIEPNKLLEVILDIKSLTAKIAFFVVSTRPATKTLPTGENAHLIIEDWGWWKRKLIGPQLFSGVRTREHADSFDFVAQPNPPTLTREEVKRIRGLVP